MSLDCKICKGEGFVCEDHPDVAWGYGDNCCGGAGMLCECQKRSKGWGYKLTEKGYELYELTEGGKNGMKKTAKQIMAKHTTEASVQDAVLTFLEVKGCVVWRANTGGRHTSYTSKKTGLTKEGYVAFGPKGQPDIQGWIPWKKIGHGTAVPIYIETKRPGISIKSPEQIAFIENAKRDGCFAMFAKSVDEVMEEWERFIRWT